MVPKDKIPISSLFEDQKEKISWEWLKGLDLVRVGTAKDGSCLYHSILSCMTKVFRDRNSGGIPVSRRELVKNTRIQLAGKLKEYYPKLSRGTLASLSDSLPRYKLDSLIDEIINKPSTDMVFFELLSEVYTIDIYVLDLEKKDVYMLGDDDLLRKSRPSIVLMYLPGHYEYVGLIDGAGKIVTLFSPTNSFIELIRQREKDKILDKE